MSKGQKQLPNCMKIAEASISALSNASSVTFNAYTVTDFCVAQHESAARNDSVTVYNKKYPDNAI
jgi:hypothetical protein